MKGFSRILSFLAMNAFAMAAQQPNILFILVDDQDLHLNSTSTMPVLQSEMVAKGVTFTSHWTTLTNCCPSRTTIMRGQYAHNTNITNVEAPGGNYDKFLASGFNSDYLPHWLVDAGYNAEYMGKFLNGMNTVNYVKKPEGWTNVDALLDPYTYWYNTPVLSGNGETPIYYHGYHQTDVLRAKALSRLENLTAQSKPWFLAIAPTTPHVQGGTPEFYPVPLARYSNAAPGAISPRIPSFNPADNYQEQKATFLQTFPLLTTEQITGVDLHYRRRIQALQGIDDIIEDIISYLDNKGVLDNTYIVYTTDNGYHLGNYRVPGGKALPYVTDSNIPLIVRGPGIPAGVTSELPSLHSDFAPTFLDIAGVPQSKWPAYFDGRSLLQNWQNPSQAQPTSDAQDILTIEFWGTGAVEALHYPIKNLEKNSYKVVRIATPGRSWFYSKWCDGTRELYDTTTDPYELTNLALNPNATISHLITRMNALLLVTKSCYEGSCRNAWSDLQPKNAKNPIVNLEQALQSEYDDYFNSFPEVKFQRCMNYQDVENEMPYYPTSAAGELGEAYRTPTDNFLISVPTGKQIPYNTNMYGSEAQRHVDIQTILKMARTLNSSQLGGVYKKSPQ